MKLEEFATETVLDTGRYRCREGEEQELLH
jgi:hypothetical protein